MVLTRLCQRELRFVDKVLQRWECQLHQPELLRRLDGFDWHGRFLLFVSSLAQIEEKAPYAPVYEHVTVEGASFAFHDVFEPSRLYVGGKCVQYSALLSDRIELVSCQFLTV